ncbi:hypothetical protein RND71_016561 [Anisodus tanguticus]|uniref:X8 domain-containing protein n=1 Tax=Anisodus tanguticus TaxID=243964 RepID=A0AAE1S7F8_9SOLA|nr:hypothetical protein RND71_016561 [Anisodus tanguticus]
MSGVTMQAQKEAPSDMQCKDKFLLQSVVASAVTNPKDIIQETFNKEEGRVVDECKLKVIYLPSPSPVAEGSEEGSSSKESMKDNGHQNCSEAKSVISRLMVEKASALQQSNRLRQELIRQFELSLIHVFLHLGVGVKLWCVADEWATDITLAAFLDKACKRGHCVDLQPGKPCYLPFTVRSHASYVLNLLYRKKTRKCPPHLGILKSVDPCKFLSILTLGDLRDTSWK